MRFTSVFYILLAISGVCAFLVPPRVTEAARPMLAVSGVPWM